MTEENNQTPTESVNETQEQQEVQQQEEPKKGATQFYKEQATQYQKKINEYQQQLEEKEKYIMEFKEQKLREQNNFQELSDTYKQRYEQKEQEYNQFKDLYVQDKKLDAIRTEAIKAGIRPEAMQDLENFDLNQVEIETTSTGRYNVLNAKEFVEGIKQARNFWFNDSYPPSINNGQPQTPPPEKVKTPQELLDLQKTDKAAYNREMQRFAAARNLRK